MNFLYKTFIGRIILKIFVVNRVSSKIGGFFLNTRISKLWINGFIKKHNINLNEYESKKYKSFNDFFTRNINLEYRPISNNINDFISPCDSRLSVYKISDNLVLNIKNSKYTLNELVNNEYDLSDYKNGYALVFRLCVDNYHHYCFVDDGNITHTSEIKGKLYTVRPISYDYKVFSKNHRIYSVLSTKNYNEIIYIEVGATMVGKIVNRDITSFKRGEEKGYFKMGGSTIVLLVKDNIININKNILDNSNKDIETIVKYGETIGNKILN